LIWINCDGGSGTAKSCLPDSVLIAGLLPGQYQGMHGFRKHDNAPKAATSMTLRATIRQSWPANSTPPTPFGLWHSAVPSMHCCRRHAARNGRRPWPWRATEGFLFVRARRKGRSDTDLQQARDARSAKAWCRHQRRGGQHGVQLQLPHKYRLS